MIPPEHELPATHPPGADWTYRRRLDNFDPFPRVMVRVLLNRLPLLTAKPVGRTVDLDAAGCIRVKAGRRRSDVMQCVELGGELLMKLSTRRREINQAGLVGGKGTLRIRNRCP